MPLVTALHVVPVSEDLRITPSLPTTRPVEELMKCTSLKAVVVPEVCELHVEPPFVVFNITP